MRWENRGMISSEESYNSRVKCQRFIVLFTSSCITNQECEKDVRMENFTQSILLVAAENDFICSTLKVHVHVLLNSTKKRTLIRSSVLKI